MSLPNEIKMCTICTSNVSCGSGETVSSTTIGSFSGAMVSGVTDGNAMHDVTSRGTATEPSSTVPHTPSIPAAAPILLK